MLGQPRATQRYESKRATLDAELLIEMRSLTGDRVPLHLLAAMLYPRPNRVVVQVGLGRRGSHRPISDVLGSDDLCRRAPELRKQPW